MGTVAGATPADDTGWAVADVTSYGNDSGGGMEPYCHDRPRGEERLYSLPENNPLVSSKLLGAFV
jgi:hypothetical protein